MRRMRHLDDRGSATVLVLALAGVLATVVAGATLAGAATVARHRADAAADLAAIAAAQVAERGEEAACARAARVASGSGARLVRCAVTAGVSDVAVTVALRGWPGPWNAVTRRARAGPAGGVP